MNGRRERSNGSSNHEHHRHAGLAGAEGIIDPNTGKPLGANDPFFGEINNELADKAFWSPRPTS